MFKRAQPYRLQCTGWRLFSFEEKVLRRLFIIEFTVVLSPCIEVLEDVASAVYMTG